ncbi:hypothetical protein HK101_008433 [Irineochytrium annulatum]|nr:hypothetical protein HK101_008433 [Irineochytrium annulatum]
MTDNTANLAPAAKEGPPSYANEGEDAKVLADVVMVEDVSKDALTAGAMPTTTVLETPMAQLQSPPKEKPMSPDANASFLSKITFEWLTPIFVRGWKHPLTDDDMWSLAPDMRAKRLVEAFEKYWDEEVKLAKNVMEPEDPATAVPGSRKKPAPESTPSLLRALKRTFWNSVFPIGFLKLLSDLCTTFSPLLVKYIIIQVADPTQELSHGFALIVGLFLLQVTGSFLLNNFFQLSTRSGIVMRASMSAYIYRKTLRLSAGARQEFNSGKVINLVATDTNRIELFITYVHIIWTAPIQIAIIVGFLISQLGWAAIVGVSLLFILTPVQGVLWRMLSSIRKVVAPITDSRVKIITEVLNGIRVIKFFAWEVPFLERIQGLRTKEVDQVLKRSVLNAFVQTIAFGIPIISGAIAFVLFGISNPLNAAQVFSSLTWFTQLRFPLMFLPALISSWADFKVAIMRIEGLLLAAELDEQPPIDSTLPVAVQIENGEFMWDSLPPKAGAAAEAGKPDKKMTRKEKKKEKKGKNATDTKEKQSAADEKPSTDSDNVAVVPKAILRDINISLPKGSLTAIVGAVGSGKSSLLNAMIGEMRRVSGTVAFSGSLGYAPQSAWIQNATLEQNVTFGQPYEKDRYLRALRDCALESDLKVLPDGDQTSIGERGINLSGGQKQRVNLARCVYYNPEICLLDDPLSAVDAHATRLNGRLQVGKFLMEECILGALAGKTRVLVTHQLHFLSKVDHVIVMRDGQIVEQGSYSGLLEAKGEFATLIKNYGAEEDGETEAERKDRRKENLKDEKEKLEKLGDAVLNQSKPGKDIMKEEDRATGTVSGKVWWAYLVAAGKYQFLFGLIFCLLFLQITRVGNDLWLVWWSEDLFAGRFSLSGYIGVYVGWGIAQAFSTYLFGIFFAYAGTRAARVLHSAAITRILRAPSSFYDTTPLGRIINRFAKDQDSIDNSLADAYRMFVNTLATSLSTFILICYATPLFVVPLVPLLGVYYFMQAVYRKTSRELKRLDSTTRSPLYANFGETLTGLPTIRAYREQDRFIKNNDVSTDTNNMPYYMLLTAQRWLGLRLETLGAILVFFAATFGILAKGSISPALVGLSLSYALQVTQILNWCIRQFTDTEIAMNAVERVQHYGYEVEVEADAINPNNRTPEGWPAKGTISFKGVEMQYGPDLPLVLKGVDFDIRDREKVGVVGRTGSGKSSLMQSLFRMVEISSGSIVVDGINVHEIGLRDLRVGLAIIPQDPVLFSGSYRTNLDPFDEYEDADLWDALARAGLKSKVVDTDGGLDGKVTDGGENISVGQRQLLCLARAMLKKPRIIIMDEATANVDYETDALIQKALRDDFKDATVLTIAHRLNTIIDYDRVMVLDAGKIVEFDSPANLLDTDSRFKGMLAETGAANFELLKALANGQGSAEDVIAVATAGASGSVDVLGVAATAAE